MGTVVLARILSVQTDREDQRLRGQLTKGAALLIAIATALGTFGGIATRSITADALYLQIAIVLASLVGFGLAHYGKATAAALFLNSACSAIVTLTASPLFHSYQAGKIAFVAPILLAGLLLGGRAVLVFGSLSTLAALSIAVVEGSLARSESISTVLILIVATGLTWLIIRTLEQALARAREQTAAALAAERSLREQQALLEDANAELRSANQQQAALIELVRDLETPAIPLLEGVLALPLIGHIDTRRANILTETTLQAVHRERARVVLIDITGVSVVDTAVAQRIEQLAQAIRLLGARVILTGMRAEVAQTIAAQGLDFSAVETAGRLQDGVARVISEASQIVARPAMRAGNGHESWS